MSISAPSPTIIIPDDNELALPAPLTSRNLHPRSRAVSLARSAHSGSLSRPALRTSSRSQKMSTRHRSDSLSDADEPHFIQALMHPDTGGMEEGSSSSHASRGAGKRNQMEDVLRRSKRRRISFVDWMVSSDEGEESVDQLISDNEDEKPGIPSTSTSTSIAGPSTQGTLFSSQGSNLPSSPPGYVSSPSLAKILHATDIEPPPSIKSLHDHNNKPSTSTIPPVPVAPPVPERQPEPLSEYTCPICFFPPTNATLTPCGHICCGACLFTAVKTTMHRGAMMPTGEPNVARSVFSFSVLFSTAC